MQLSAGQDVRLKNYRARSPFYTSRTTFESFPSRTVKHGVLAGLPIRSKITALLIFLPENLEKFRSTELYFAAPEGSTIFLCRSSLGYTSMESCQSADLKYMQFSAAQDVRLKITALEALSIDGL